VVEQNRGSILNKRSMKHQMALAGLGLIGRIPVVLLLLA